MFSLDQLRRRQEQRQSQALESWNQAKEDVKAALALAAAKEREYREVSADVERRLEALELVSRMALEPAETGSLLKAPENQPKLMPPKDSGEDITALSRAVTPVAVRGHPLKPAAIESRVHKSSRPLFTSDVRSKLARLSILQ